MSKVNWGEVFGNAMDELMDKVGSVRERAYYRALKDWYTTCFYGYDIPKNMAERGVPYSSDCFLGKSIEQETQDMCEEIMSALKAAYEANREKTPKEKLIEELKEFKVKDKEYGISFVAGKLNSVLRYINDPEISELI